MKSAVHKRLTLEGKWTIQETVCEEDPYDRCYKIVFESVCHRVHGNQLSLIERSARGVAFNPPSFSPVSSPSEPTLADFFSPDSSDAKIALTAPKWHNESLIKSNKRINNQVTHNIKRKQVIKEESDDCVIISSNSSPKRTKEVSLSPEKISTPVSIQVSRSPVPALPVCDIWESLSTGAQRLWRLLQRRYGRESFTAAAAWRDCYSSRSRPDGGVFAEWLGLLEELGVLASQRAFKISLEGRKRLRYTLLLICNEGTDSFLDSFIGEEN